MVFCADERTFRECLNKKLLGLPQRYMETVLNICPGMPLFLFDSTKRLLFGVFTAVSPGADSIDPWAWSSTSQRTTGFPA